LSIILSIHSGTHDSSVSVFDNYECLSAIHSERLTRKKCDGGFPLEALAEALSIAGKSPEDVSQIVINRGYFPAKYLNIPNFKQLRYKFKKRKGKDIHKFIEHLQKDQGALSANEVFKEKFFLKDCGFLPNTPIYFYNHHLAHALSAFFYNDFDNALIYTADGGGDGVFYSSRIFKNGKLTSLFGDDLHFFYQNMSNSLGLAYGICTQSLGFTMNRHEGKLTGLAAFGKPEISEEFKSIFSISDSGEIGAKLTQENFKSHILAICKNVSREVVAASIQDALESLITEAIKRQMRLHGVNKLALAGGVFANVRLNSCLSKLDEVDDLFVFPAMGDDGLSVGGALEFLMERDGIEKWNSKRRRIDNTYFGKPYTLDSAPLPKGVKELFNKDIAKQAATLISQGKVGAIYTQRMEFGPRALGARSIIAAPVQRDINDSLNKRLDRSDFMPFAPYVLDEDADRVFDIPDSAHYACRFMTITVDVKKEWRDKIPAVVHVDGTARPQTTNKSINPLYATILEEYKNKTGIPVLVNTSFNVHEHPIVNTPEECFTALQQDRVDFVVTDSAIYVRDV
jgi:carbamoyltransferase